MRYSISIHALREEGDSRHAALAGVLVDFYPRPPRGGRPFHGLQVGIGLVFLSTPSARRATARIRAAKRRRMISIHALREEGDEGFAIYNALLEKFLSTPSARRATRDVCKRYPDG